MQRALAALRHFGLIENVKGDDDQTVRFSHRGLDIVPTIEKQIPEWFQAVRDAARSRSASRDLARLGGQFRRITNCAVFSSGA